jgi:acyl-CoA thioesterase-1
MATRRTAFAVVGAALGITAVGAAAVARLRRVLGIRRAAAAAINETIPVNSAFWRARAHTGAQTRSPGEGELVYAALGDSTAQGLGASDPDHGYVGILAERIARRSGRTVRTVNLSVSGSTVEQAVGYQVPRLERMTHDVASDAVHNTVPDVVTVAIGANDIALWDAARFEQALAAVFDALPEHAIVAELPCFHLPWNERRVAEANRIVHRLAAARGLAVAPLHRATGRYGLPGAVSRSARDLFHPNDRGYRHWARAFEPLVDERVDALCTADVLSPTAPLDAPSTDPPGRPWPVGGPA